MSSSAVTKIFLIAVNAVCTEICLTPPNPPAKHEEKSQFKIGEGVQDVVPMQLIRKTSKVLTHFMNVIDLFAVYAQQYPESPLSRNVSGILLDWHPIPSTLHISSTFAVGVVLMVVASYLRIACYRHLGRYFTYELSLREEHKLVTDGPYAVVRHPSYTALFIYFAGLALTLLGDGSWWAEYGVFSGVGRAMGMGLVVIITVWVLFFLTRVQLEDYVLSTNFKGQWSRWSQQTPYKLLPLVY